VTATRCSRCCILPVEYILGFWLDLSEIDMENNVLRHDLRDVPSRSPRSNCCDYLLLLISVAPPTHLNDSCMRYSQTSQWLADLRVLGADGIIGFCRTPCCPLRRIHLAGNFKLCQLQVVGCGSPSTVTDHRLLAAHAWDIVLSKLGALESANVFWGRRLSSRRRARMGPKRKARLEQITDDSPISVLISEN
jgi:hypothetical protein